MKPSGGASATATAFTESDRRWPSEDKGLQGSKRKAAHQREDFVLGAADVAHFHRHGYVVIPNALDAAQLDLLRRECDDLLRAVREQGISLVRNAGCVLEPLSTLQAGLSKADTSFLSERAARLPATTSLLLEAGPFARVAAAVLHVSDVVYLLNEQYIVKPAHTGREVSFAWHEDSAYLAPEYRRIPTVALWCALDDVNEANGCLHVARRVDLDEDASPEERPPPRPAAPVIDSDAAYIQCHEWRRGRPDDLPGATRVYSRQQSIAVPMRAGSILVMSAFLPHRSGANASGAPRRAFMPQYSSRPVRSPAGEAVALAVPVNLLNA